MELAALSGMLQGEAGVEESTMMGSPCLRYQDAFFAMWFDKGNALIIKVPSQRVDELISKGKGKEFNFTSKRFKEWVLIPPESKAAYPSYLREALAYVSGK